MSWDFQGIKSPMLLEKLLARLEALGDSADDTQASNHHTQKIAELVLVYDENLEFVDEDWLLDLDSPMLEIS
ncbi:MAG: hypothetical protein RMY62_020705 [Nostoc sp. ZfuVER08]|jgi:hypothetical protein|nr:hypothetical protein [Nostoc sp. ZfuVER08]